VKTAISIPDQLFREAERTAKRLKIPRSRLYSEAIERYLRESREQDVTERLNAIYKTEDSELAPALQALQFASFPRERW